MKTLLLVILLSLIGFTSGAEVYINDIEKYRIEVPVSWGIRQEGGAHKTFFEIDNKGSYFSVFVPPYKYTAMWAAYAVARDMAEKDEVIRVSTREQRIGKYLTGRIDYIYEKEGRIFHVRLNIIEGNRKLYVLSFHAARKLFAANVDKVNKAVSTFDLIKDGSIKKEKKEYTNPEYLFSLKYPARWVEYDDKRASRPLVLYIEPGVSVFVMVSPVEYMIDTSTGVVFSVGRGNYAADGGPMIKEVSKKIQKSIRENNIDFEKYRQYSSEVDGRLAMELLIEYKPEDSPDKEEGSAESGSGKVFRFSQKEKKIREFYCLTMAGANVLAFVYSSPKKKFKRYLDEFEDVIESVTIEAK